MPVSEKLIDQFVEACRDVAAHGLIRCSSGNLSWRVGKDLMLIKASRSWMARATRDDVVACRISDGTALRGERPSAEIGFHAGILGTRSDVHVVLHFQTPCATALACSAGEDVDYFVIPEIPFYIGPIGAVPYSTPGSSQLAEAVVSAMQDHDLAQLRNHGQVTVAGDFAHAIQNAEFFELACEIILRAGKRLVPMSEADAGELLALKRGPSRPGV